MENAKAATSARALHWPLEFPDIIGRGGFDVVLGNPPWEVMQLANKEYFASRIPEIAELAGAKGKKAIDSLRITNPIAYEEFVEAKRYFDAVNEFARSTGRFDLTARGKVNSYSLFAEHFSNSVNAFGRAGIIVPTGIATDSSTSEVRRCRTSSCATSGSKHPGPGLSGKAFARRRAYPSAELSYCGTDISHDR